MNNKLLIEKTDLFDKYAVLDKNEKVIYLDIVKKERDIRLNDIYLGRIKKINKIMNSALVNIGNDDVYLNIKNRKFTEGQEVYIQIKREKEKHKKPVADTDISISSKYIVLIYEESFVSFSKKIVENNRIKDLKYFLEKKYKGKFGILVRTDAENLSIEDIDNEIESLSRKFESIFTPTIGLKYTEKEDINQIDKISTKFCIEKILCNDNDYIKQLKKTFKNIDFEYHYGFLFNRKGIDFNKLLNSEFVYENFNIKINYLEALIVFDINSGYIHNNKQRYEKIYEINLLAFEEILKIIYILKIGGIVIIDFITMDSKNSNKLFNYIENNIKKIYNINRKVKTCKMSTSSLLEIVIQKNDRSIIDSISKKCHLCDGNGIRLNDELLLDDFYLKISEVVDKEIKYIVKIPYIFSHLENKIEKILLDSGIEFEINFYYGSEIILQGDKYGNK